MATQIPTFQSDRVSAIPNMGIVEQSGMRAMGQATREMTKVFDTIGDFANKKAYEFMEREQTLAAEEAVRGGGLNPKDLGDPITAADKIYRQAAINTYAIDVDRQISENMSRIQLESKFNPDGFKKKAEGFVSGLASELPPELKNGAQQLANSHIVKGYSQLNSQLQERVLAENAASREAALARYAADVVNNAVDPEVGIAKAAAIIEADPETLTEGLKTAKIDEWTRGLTEQVVMKRVMDGQMSVQAAEDAMVSSGIALTPAKQQSIYTAYNTKLNFELQQRNMLEAERDVAMKETRDQFYGSLNNPELTLEQKLAQRESTIALMKNKGASEKDIFDFSQSSLDLVYNTGTDNDSVVNGIKFTISTGDFKTASTVLESALSSGNIKQSTYFTLAEEIQAAEASPLSQPVPKKFFNDIDAIYFPLANQARTPGGLDAISDMRLKSEIQRQKFESDNLRAIFENDLAQGKSSAEAMQNIKTNFVANLESARAPDNAPAVVKKYYGSLDGWLNEPAIDQYKQIVESPITKNNYKDKAAFMLQRLQTKQSEYNPDVYNQYQEQILEMISYFEQMDAQQ